MTQNKTTCLFKNLLLLGIIFTISCSPDKKEPAEVVLAKVGDREITPIEFRFRAELTIRPDNFKDKNVTLNNLISEKILAIEAGPDHELLKNKPFQSRLKGIKEQLMRDELYKKVAVDVVVLDSADVYKTYCNSMREYELEFYTINDQQLVKKIRTALDSVPDMADQIFDDLNAQIGKKPMHEVKYQDPDDDAIHEALYSDKLDVGTIIGPIRLTSGAHILMKVTNWSDNLIFGGGEAELIRWNEVSKKMRQAKSRELWNSYQADLMRDKKIEFDDESFKIISESALAYHLKKAAFDTSTSQMTEIPFDEPEIDMDAPFLKVDNMRWTVGDFRDAILIHPLVFRTKYLNKENFTRQFSLAIKDMVRDYFLTREAYKRSLDKSKSINHTVEMWQDAILAENQQKTIISSAMEAGIVTKDDPVGISEYWKTEMLKLQNNFSHSIKINYDELNKIRLTKIDFFAIRPGVPYPVSVPNFPLLIASDDLSYAKQDSSNYQ